MAWGRNSRNCLMKKDFGHIHVFYLNGASFKKWCPILDTRLPDSTEPTMLIYIWKTIIISFSLMVRDVRERVRCNKGLVILWRIVTFRLSMYLICQERRIVKDLKYCQYEHNLKYSCGRKKYVIVCIVKLGMLNKYISKLLQYW